MDLRPVASSVLAAVGYDARTRCMEVDFRDSGLRYRYLDVPPEVFAALMAAPSKGTFLNDHIKGRYESFRLQIPSPEG